jgi:hypothetical protein
LPFEGKMTSETYPNGMTAKYTFNAAGEATGIEYEKTVHCAGTCPEHTYDEADRLIDTSVEYEALGNQTKIPAADAGEHEITASFYADNQVAVQKQNGETTNYTYDPVGRTEKTVSEGTTKATVVNHYPGPGEAISWACEESAKECEEGKGAKWTRDIPGIDGSLAATQHDSEAAVLQLHDLEGDVVATAAVSETETKLLTTYNPTEFGVPVNGTPPTKYSWLGASGLATEQASGAANPGGGSYVPQLGAPLQTQPVAPPGAPDGTYVNPYIGSAGSAADFASDSAYAAGAPGREAARQKAAEEEWERLHPPPPPGAVPSPGEGGAGPIGGSPGWLCEDAAVSGQEVPGCFNSVFFEQFEATGGEKGAVDASSLLGSLTGILKGGLHGGEIAWQSLEAGGRFVKRNAGRFLAMMSDVGTFAEASLALAFGGTACVAGAVGASVVAPYAAPFVWFGCATFIFGNTALLGWSAFDLYENASHIR